MNLRAIIFSILPTMIASSMAFAHANHGSSAEERSTVQLNGESIYNLNSKWRNQDGKEIKFESLKGNPIVVAMLYTSCKDACPMTIENLKSIEGKLSESTRSKVKFAVFSFDTERDTPAKLKEFAQKRSLDLSRWSLFHGSPADVRKLAAVLGVQYKKETNGDYDHSNAITILNNDGVIVFQQMGLKNQPNEPVSKLESLVK